MKEILMKNIGVKVLSRTNLEQKSTKSTLLTDNTRGLMLCSTASHHSIVRKIKD